MHMPHARREFLKRSALLCTQLTFPWVAPAQIAEKSKDSAPEADLAPRNWHQWRGPLANGVGPLADPPLEWSEKKNIKWKLPLPGKGHSSPIVWGELVFLMSAEPYGKPTKPVYDNAPGSHDNVGVNQFYNFAVIAVRRADGKVAWRTKVREEFPHEGGHMTGSLVSNSPTTDGNLIFASFGSRGLYCLDLAGNIKWQKDLGRMQTLHAHGEGSSPVLYKDLLILNWDHEGDSFLYAFDKRTGAERWKVARDEKTSWSTPLRSEENTSELQSRG